MINKFPVTLDEFKMFFIREAGIEYQPFPSWEKTVWDTGDICVIDNVYYASLIPLNHTSPLENDPEDPVWDILSYIYLEDSWYMRGDIVYYRGKYFKALAETNDVPGNSGNWKLVDEKEEFEGARPWAPPVAYKVGDKVIRAVNYKVGVWEAQVGDNYTDPAAKMVDEEKDLEYWTEAEDDTEDLSECILDSDILRAMGEAAFKFNKKLFTEEKGKLIFLYLTMFFLVYDRQMAASGINGNSAAGPVIHRTVGKMTVTYMESKLFKSNPSYEFLASNDYGKKAFALMAPYLRGGVLVMRGASTGE